VDLAAENPNALEVYIARSGAVLAEETWMPNVLAWLLYAVREDQLAAVLIDIAMNGADKELFYARDLETRGVELLGKAA
jgi:hypothetical protein